MLPPSHYLCRSVRGTRLHIAVALLIILRAGQSRALFPRGEKGKFLFSRPAPGPTQPPYSTSSFARVKKAAARNWPKIFNYRGELFRVHIRALTSLPIFYHGAMAPSGPGPTHYRGFTITLRHTTVGRIPLDEWSARRRDLYLTTHNTHNKHPCLRWDSSPQSQLANGTRSTP